MKNNVLIGLLILGLAAGTYAVAAKNLTIKGSTTVLPITQSCAEAFMNKHADVNISVQGGGSGVGIASIIDGTADIGDASRPAKDKEITKAKENGIELYENVVAMDGIAVIVHPSNPISAITKEQIKNIYTGKISNWNEVGGRKGRIVVISRDSASGTFETFNELALDKEKVRPDALLNASNQAVAQIIARTPGAIGYVGLGYLSSAVKGLEVEGVLPTKENVVNGSYILARKLFMYTKGKPKGITADFIDYVMSKEGQKLVDKAGFVAIK
ncbi:MAG: phosphate ABC transporter substrate-binding protein [Candidatus Aminicenantes bacterium]|nr:phosphate ABC transporter substrate-binding protein [Candidatus Aminicenantes bacterium]